ncbi:MAG: tetratricopeptide repeat protein [Leptolyngbyaceae cyanobacterium bins.59]|nr:tetratricopeptide repeat protein [Leptolyngbyaceae cyanobacterium bins.59]
MPFSSLIPSSTGLLIAGVVCLGWVISLCLHEFGHAIVAYWGGDTSVKEKGYLTLNPLKYTDPTLSLMMPLIFLLLGGIALPGGAVYIDHGKLRNRWWESAVSLAGPTASGLTALVLASPFWLGWLGPVTDHWVWLALALLVFLEIFACLFNLLPVPSLDGYGALEPWLPDSIRQPLNRLGRYSLWILFGLFMVAPQVGRPLWRAVYDIGDWLQVPPALVGQGFALFDQGMWAIFLTGLGMYLIARQVSRSPQEATYDRANRLLKAGKLEEALATYQQLITLHPDYSPAWVMQATTLHALKRSSEALNSLDQAIELQPDNPLTWVQKGWLLGEMERYEESIVAFDRAIELHPQYGDAWYNRACDQTLLGDQEGALQSLRRAYDLDYYRFRHLAKTDTCFDALREHPRFQKMLRVPPHRLEMEEALAKEKR